MKTLTLKLPEVLENKLNAFARKKGQSRSEIVRRALKQYLEDDNMDQSGTFLDLSRDVMGCIEGPEDLSSNPAHLKDYGK